MARRHGACDDDRIMQAKSKPWASAGWAAAAVPGAGYAALLLIDAFRCDPGHAAFMAFFTGFVALPLAGFAFGATALVVVLFRGEFPLRAWRIACCALAVGAVIGTAVMCASWMHDPTFCRIEL